MMMMMIEIKIEPNPKKEENKKKEKKKNRQNWIFQSPGAEQESKIEGELTERWRAVYQLQGFSGNPGKKILGTGNTSSPSLSLSRYTIPML